MSTNTSTKKSTVLNESIMNRVAPKQAEKAQVDPFANIQANPFFKIVMSDAQPEAKRVELAKALTWDKTATKAQNRERIQEFDKFKEYLSDFREKMANEIIQLTNTDTYGELQKTFKEMNGDLLDFNQKMGKLTGILESLHNLRSKGITLDAFTQIRADKAHEQEVHLKMEDFEKRTNDIQEKINNILRENAILSTQKTFLGTFTGALTKEAAAKTAENGVLLDKLTVEAEALKSEIEAYNASNANRENPMGDYAEDIKHLRELLDVSTEEHKKNQQEVVSSALNFVKTSKTRIGSIRDNLGRMGNQVENLFDANSNMQSVYVVMSEALEDATKNNKTLSEQLDAAVEGETKSEADARQQNKMNVDQFITSIDRTNQDTLTTYADLQSQSIRINTMKSANDDMTFKVRNMHTQGVAGVADRLSVVLQAVSGAALSEAAANARDTLSAMNENTNNIAQMEVIRVATGIEDENRELTKALDELATYGDVMKAATKISRDGLSEMQDKLRELRDLSETVRETVHDAISVNAETDKSVSPEIQQKPATNGFTSPFNFQ